MTDKFDDAHANREFEPGYPDGESTPTEGTFGDVGKQTFVIYAKNSNIDSLTRILRWLIVIGIVANVIAQVWIAWGRP